MKNLAFFGLKLAVILTLFILSKASFEEDVLSMHNECRAQHGTPALKLNKDGCGECRQYAEELASRGEISHSKSNGKYGENLCYTSSDPLHCVSMWYDEIYAYDFEKPGFSPATGHFTQLIWRNTKFLAVGKAKGKKGLNFVVARYTPPGNVIGQFKENVPRRNPIELSFPIFLFGQIGVMALSKYPSSSVLSKLSSTRIRQFYTSMTTTSILQT